MKRRAMAFEEFTREWLQRHVRKTRDGCWLWTGKLRKGYGYVSVRGEGSEGTHRLAWRLFRGPIPLETPCVLHSCDHPPCCNPEHLFLGTVLDNNRDARRKGRSVNPIGTAHGRAKLDEERVRLIRRLHAGGRSANSLAKEHGLHQSTVDALVKRLTWRHVA